MHLLVVALDYLPLPRVLVITDRALETTGAIHLPHKIIDVKLVNIGNQLTTDESIYIPHRENIVENLPQLNSEGNLLQEKVPRLQQSTDGSLVPLEITANSGVNRLPVVNIVVNRHYPLILDAKLRRLVCLLFH